MNYRTLSLEILLLILIGALSFAAFAQNFGEASHDEYGVYEAVFDLMDHIPKEDPHVTVFNVTLNSKCGEDAYPVPLANGCTFLWMKPDTPDNVKELLRSEGAHVDNSTWSDFVKKNAESVRLHEPISTPWKHKLIGPGDEPSKDWESPDLTLFVSRAGFNEKKTQAVVYVLLFSYMDKVSTAGDYFCFRLDKSDHWQVDGRVTYFAFDKTQTFPVSAFRRTLGHNFRVAGRPGRDDPGGCYVSADFESRKWSDDENGTAAIRRRCRAGSRH